MGFVADRRSGLISSENFLGLSNGVVADSEWVRAGAGAGAGAGAVWHAVAFSVRPTPFPCGSIGGGSTGHGATAAKQKAATLDAPLFYRPSTTPFFSDRNATRLATTRLSFSR